MSAASVVFEIYLFLSTLLSSSVLMDKQDCFTNQDRLYLIDGYAHYKADNVTYQNFVSYKEKCIFNNTAFYYLSLVNVSNVSNGTFVATFDKNTLLRSAQSGGRFK